MENFEGGRQRTEANLPPLSNHQLLVVAGAMGSILNLTFTVYGRSLGLTRIHEMEEFGRQLLAAIKNGDIGGINMADEPAIVETIHTLVAGNIPQVKRPGDDNKQR